jgi:ketosteroid isomerase-like protein
MLLALLTILAVQENPLSSLLAADRGLSDSSARSCFACAMGPAFHPEAVLLFEGAPVVRGAGPARALLEAQTPLVAMTDLSFLRIQWQALHVELSQDGTLGITWGFVVLDPAGPDSLRFSRYLTAWRRDGTGWRVEATVWTGFRPPDRIQFPSGWQAPELPPVNAGGGAASFIKADRAFAERAGRVTVGAAFAEYAAPDAVLFTGNGLLARGPEAIKAALASQAQAQWSWRPVIAGAAEDGSLGWTVGESTIRALGRDGAPVTRLGKYLTVWRRERNGDVKYIVDMGNVRPEPRK